MNSTEYYIPGMEIAALSRMEYIKLYLDGSTI